ncbi:MAG: hypothetical protein JWM80_6502 [Cyanobacteria bacterium RYN_339]|nr:hypothetical protein [Cyanobacteria bacterium RYN_339]
MRRWLWAACWLAACTPLPPTVPEPTPAALWPAPADMGAAIAAAKLDEGPILEKGTTAWLIHLDVYKDRQPIIVPPNLGIDFKSGNAAPLHTHLANGILSVETTERRRYTLGQVFTLWGVPLAGATAYVNGKAAPDAAGVELADLQEIAVVFGTPPATIPSTLPAWTGVFPQ